MTVPDPLAPIDLAGPREPNDLDDGGFRSELPAVRRWARDEGMLHKAHLMRDKDQVDLAATVPLLGHEARTWLRQTLATVYPGHAWIERL